MSAITIFLIGKYIDTIPSKENICQIYVVFDRHCPIPNNNANSAALITDSIKEMTLLLT